MTTISKERDWAVTPEEIQSWFGKAKRRSLTPKTYSEIAAGINKLRWPSDPPPKNPSRPSTSNSGLWDVKAATNAAKALLNEMPAMLSHWRDRNWAPNDQPAYPVISALNTALSVAMPYIEHPLGRYKTATGRKTPKDWHMPSVLIAILVIRTLLDAGEDQPGITHNSLVVRIVKKALVRMKFPGSTTLSQNAIAAHLKRWNSKHGSLIQKRPAALVTK